MFAHTGILCTGPTIVELQMRIVYSRYPVHKGGSAKNHKNKLPVLRLPQREDILISSSCSVITVTHRGSTANFGSFFIVPTTVCAQQLVYVDNNPLLHKHLMLIINVRES